jgi:hypothetical protein
MQTLKIKTHKMKNTHAGNYLFILSKGLNAGKPLQNPCPNCFVLFGKMRKRRICSTGFASAYGREISLGLFLPAQ